ncbi:MAG TPA: DUF881 domain-containing protein [Marmoricola sp.]|nr:DUF881 domain-containing protein [Marmoricola sp.]
MSHQAELDANDSPEHRALAALGLFPFLDSAALNDEYIEAHASHRPAQSKAWLLIAVAVLTVLVVVAASQTAANSTADAKQRDDLIAQIHQRQATMKTLTSEITRAQSAINALQSGLSSNKDLSGSTRSRLGSWGTSAGISAVTGPGVEVIVDNAPKSAGARGVVQDRDLQQLVNGLWEAGAEAVSINGQRITSLTAIRTAGAAITVNYQSLTPPYVVDAIGNPATLPAKFAQTDSGAAWLDLQNQLGMVYSMNTKADLTLGAATLPSLRFARPASNADTSGGSGQ